MALVTILSVIGIGSYTQATVKSRDTLRKSELSQISKALEAFNQDIGRYPYVGSTDPTDTAKYGVIYCYRKIAGVVTSPSCDGNKLNTLIGDSIADVAITNYITLPSDPSGTRKYIYLTTDGTTFALYASLENNQDKDLIQTGGVPNMNPWNIDCGIAKCNYKITEEGLARSL